jgi:integrase
MLYTWPDGYATWPNWLALWGCRRWYCWRAACLVTLSCVAICGHPMPWLTAASMRIASSSSASSRRSRPHDLRHACLSTWLNGGVYPTQVAEWAGHGVDVLLRIYAKCVVGQDELAKRRISEALRQD